MSRRGLRHAWRCVVALAGVSFVSATVLASPVARPAHTPGPRAVAPTLAPEPVPEAGTEVQPPVPPTPQWETLFVDHFDGQAGTWPEQWHHMTDWNAAAQNGLGQLEVGHVGQIRSTPGWVLPVGTQVKVSASLVMPDTGSNYAALWVQHPDAADPREIDVIESYGPSKPTGAQLGSHLCYDETLDNGVDECAAAGRVPELWPVGQAFPDGAKPWDAFWQYDAEFTVGGDQVRYGAQDGSGNLAYDVTSSPDPSRVPGNAVPFHLRLSNKDVEAEHVVPGGERHNMLVDWVMVQVLYPTGVS